VKDDELDDPREYKWQPFDFFLDDRVEPEKERKEQERLQAILDNIDNYNGDGLGQKEVK
jgi:hypothetical protein